MTSNVWSLSNCLATTQTPSRSSSQLVGDANKHHTPRRTPHNFQPSPFTNEFIQSLENKFAVIFIFLQLFGVKISVLELLFSLLMFFFVMHAKCR